MVMFLWCSSVLFYIFLESTTAIERSSLIKQVSRKQIVLKYSFWVYSWSIASFIGQIVIVSVKRDSFAQSSRQIVFVSLKCDSFAQI